MPRRTLAAAVALPLLLLAAVLAVGPGAAQSPTNGATPAALPGVSSVVLNRATPSSAPEDELALGRVTIAPGASIPPHVHPGTQLATIASGTLTYTVLTGTIDVTRASGGSAAASPAAPVPIGAGQTALLRPGDSVTEQPGALHTARNVGDEPVVILLATLFRAGEPRTVFATPVP